MGGIDDEDHGLLIVIRRNVDGRAVQQSSYRFGHLSAILVMVHKEAKMPGQRRGFNVGTDKPDVTDTGGGFFLQNSGNMSAAVDLQELAGEERHCNPSWLIRGQASLQQ
jgi:hypothetical protein